MDARNPTLVSGAGLNLSGWDGQCCSAEHDSAARLGRTDCPAEHDRGPQAQFSILCLVSSCLLPSILLLGEPPRPLRRLDDAQRRGLGAITTRRGGLRSHCKAEAPLAYVILQTKVMTLCRACQCFLERSVQTHHSAWTSPHASPSPVGR
jgi:hypothetical protein